MYINHNGSLLIKDRSASWWARVNPRYTTKKFWLGWLIVFFPIFASDLLHTMMVIYLGPVLAMCLITIYVMSSLYLGLRVANG